MGGHRTTRVLVGSVTASVAFSGLVTACSDDSGATSVVDPAAAYTAIVEWQAAEQEPILDEKGEPKLPVIFVVAADGATVDVGVQAAVAESTVDDAVVRFADDVSDGFDSDADGAPVRDEGIMLAVGVIPEPSRTIDVQVARFVAQDDYEQLDVEITAIEHPTGTDPHPPLAEVTAVAEP